MNLVDAFQGFYDVARNVAGATRFTSRARVGIAATREFSTTLELAVLTQGLEQTLSFNTVRRAHLNARRNWSVG